MDVTIKCVRLRVFQGCFLARRGTCLPVGVRWLTGSRLVRACLHITLTTGHGFLFAPRQRHWYIYMSRERSLQVGRDRKTLQWVYYCCLILPTNCHIMSSSTAYPGPGCGGSKSISEAQRLLSPAPYTSYSGGILTHLAPKFSLGEKNCDSSAEKYMLHSATYWL